MGKVEAALETLADEVAKLRSGEDWQRFLSLQTALHAYSSNNVMLIVAQHALAFSQGMVGSPDPGYVAGFHTWRALGRRIEQGQHGYMVLAPCRYERHIAIGTDGQARALGQGEAPAAGETSSPDGFWLAFEPSTCSRCTRPRAPGCPSRPARSYWPAKPRPGSATWCGT